MPSTSFFDDNLKKEKKTKANEAFNEYKRQQEEAEKRREYERKYYQALQVIEKYKNKTDINGNKNKEINKKELQSLYENTKNSMNLEKPVSTELATNIRIEPSVEWNGPFNFDVTFKIGNKMMYVIKNIGELYDAFAKEKTIEYGKKLKFVAKRENFEKNSQ